MKDHTGLGRVRAAVAIVVGAAFVVSVAGGCGPSPPPRPTIDEIVAVVQRAVDAAPPGVTLVEAGPRAKPVAPTGRTHVADLGNFSEQLPSDGWSTASDGSAFCAHSQSSQFDWTKAVANAGRGVPEVALAHADAQAAILGEAGFVALDAGTTVFHENERSDEQISWSVKRPMGGSGAVAGPHPVRLVHRRIYYALGTAAFVLTRTEYEAETGLATVEIACVEGYPRAAADKPTLRVPVRETLVPLPKR